MSLNLSNGGDLVRQAQKTLECCRWQQSLFEVEPLWGDLEAAGVDHEAILGDHLLSKLTNKSLMLSAFHIVAVLHMVEHLVGHEVTEVDHETDVDDQEAIDLSNGGDTIHHA